MEEHVLTIPIAEAPSESSSPQVPAVDEENISILVDDASEGNVTFFHILQPSPDFVFKPWQHHDGN